LNVEETMNSKIKVSDEARQLAVVPLFGQLDGIDDNRVKL